MTEGFSRPNPDELLARVKAEEAQKKRGKLKIFLGYVAGVGKTFTMLEAAHQRRKDTDVVIGYVETHGRVETEALLKDLEIIPRKQMVYRGMVLSEMDINTVLARRPQLAIVDELAHENAPGRNVKRYQDIEELLASGIDVYTTLNIQHVESVRNVVAQIAGVWVRETIPDSVLDSADQIEMVDLPPDELIKRLKEGKVYVSEQIASATEKFFRKGNLIALRELALRIAAKHVDEQTIDYMKTHAITGPWSSGERILVFLGSGSSGSHLIRSARRLAYELGAEWHAINIETPDSSRVGSRRQGQIMESLRLAQRLGAKTATVHGDSSVNMVMEYVKTNNITKLVIAKPRKTLFQKLLGESALDRIIRLSQVDVYLVTGGSEPLPKETRHHSILADWRKYLLGLGLIVLATLLGRLVHEVFTPATTLMMYLLSVVITAYFWGLGPSILVSVLGVLSFDYFLVPPYFSFSITDTQYIFTFLTLLVVGFVISYLTARVRRQTRAARRRERQTAALYELGRDLAVSNDLESYVQAIIKRAKETFGHEAVIFLADPQNKDTLRVQTYGQSISVDDGEMAAAIWSFQHQKTVGHGTDTLPSAGKRYIPLVTARGAVGVLSLALNDATGDLSIEQERLLGAYADLAAIAIESMISSVSHYVN